MSETITDGDNWVQGTGELVTVIGAVDTMVMATVNNNYNSLLETLYNEEIKLGKIPSECDKRSLESCIFLVFLILPGVSRSRWFTNVIHLCWRLSLPLFDK